MSLSSIRRRLVTFILSMLLAESAYALIFIDISFFQWLSTQKGIRVFVFDIHQQRILDVHYYFEDTAAARKPSLPPWRHENLCEIFSNGTVRLLKAFSPQDYQIRTCATIQTETGKRLESSLTSSDLPPLSGPALQVLLQKASSQRGTQKASSFCHLHKKPTTADSRPLSLICPENPTAQSQERGLLGELATEVTFLTFGYTRLPCQDKSNKGLDGAFLSQDKQWLFLTESKCRQEAKTAANYLKTELSESRIRERLQVLVPSSHIRQEIERFLEQNPDHVIKLVQRVLPNGLIQSALGSFQFPLYQNTAFKTDEGLFWAALLKRLQDNPRHFAHQFSTLLKKYPEIFAIFKQILPTMEALT